MFAISRESPKIRETHCRKQNDEVVKEDEIR